MDWTRVYPELSEDFKGELPKSRGIGGEALQAPRH